MALLGQMNGKRGGMGGGGGNHHGCCHETSKNYWAKVGGGRYGREVGHPGTAGAL